MSDLEAIRATSPLIHNLTNYVVMNWSANCLLALGASPLMAHASEEIEDIGAISQGLVINIGTVSAYWRDSMILAAGFAKARKIPWVLDPVGLGASRFRADVVAEIISESVPTVIRGNASEIKALAGEASPSKGADSTAASSEAVDSALRIAKKHGCVVCVSGKTDFIVTPTETVGVENGHSLMTRVTGMGCASTALIAAFLSVQKSPFLAATHAMIVSGLCGEIAADRAKGPGSFPAAFLDALYSLDRETVLSRASVKWL